jgi:hypothetical protein
LECTLLANSKAVPALSNTQIVATVALGSVATLGWNTSAVPAEALLMLTTGVVTIRYITIIHNSDSKGAMLSLGGSGEFGLEV